jgi:hypothetical protein
VPLVGFSGDKCVTLFSHPLIDTLHEVYYEPKVILFFLFDSVVVNLFFELSSSSFLCFISHLCCKGM